MPRGRVKGSVNQVQLPTRYETGNGAINLCLAILSQAKLSESDMWLDFQKTELSKGINKDPLQIAWWVAQYLKKIEPERVEVGIEGEVKVMSMDDFKEIIGVKDES